jgi:hypothetical protein
MTASSSALVAPSLQVRPGETLRELGRTTPNKSGWFAVVALVRGDGRMSERIRLGLWMPNRARFMTLDFLPHVLDELLPYIEVAVREAERAEHGR